MKKLILIAFSLSLVGCYDTGSGEKVGQIIKLNQQGVFCKTYEAELIRGGLNNGSGAASTLFDFTIEDPSLIQDVQKALDGQYEVKIHYRMEFGTFCRSDSENHFLTKVERLDAPGHPLQVSTDVESIKEKKRRELQKQLEELQ